MNFDHSDKTKELIARVEKFMDENFILNNKDGYYLWEKETRLQKIFLLLSIEKEL